MDFNDGYSARNLTLDEVQKIFKPDFIQQLNVILINGNFGDLVMNPDTVEIIKYFREQGKSTLTIECETNGGARNQQFWQQLAELRTVVKFAIDGFEDTHSIYRRNTLYSTVLKNAQSFIKAGGHAIWKMICFDHNQHQLEPARLLSEQLGFKEFMLVDHGRNTGPVFNNQGQTEFILGNPLPEEADFNILFDRRTKSTIEVEHIKRAIKPIACQAVSGKSIYITSEGEVYPCCWLGFAPRTYGHGCFTQASNTQIKHILDSNNALENNLEDCIKWFSRVKESWSKPSFDQGHLIACNNHCGI